MSRIERPQWPLEAQIECKDVCGTWWQIFDNADIDSVLVDAAVKTLTVEASCPGCNTRYTATKQIGTVGQLPSWTMAPAASQYNREIPEQPEMAEEIEPGSDVAGLHDPTAALMPHAVAPDVPSIPQSSEPAPGQSGAGTLASTAPWFTDAERHDPPVASPAPWLAHE